jgi:hypothetical protein
VSLSAEDNHPRLQQMVEALDAEFPGCISSGCFSRAYVSRVMCKPDSSNPRVQRTFEYSRSKLVKVLQWRAKFLPTPLDPADLAAQLQCGSMYWYVAAPHDATVGTCRVCHCGV